MPAAMLAFLLGDRLQDQSAAPPTEEMLAGAPPLELRQIRLPGPMTETVTGKRSQQSGDGSYIHLQWPADSTERRAIRQTLHQCLGVRLARIGSGGQMLEMEPASHRQFSQYAREFTQPMDERDRQLASAWDTLPGRTVRLYPVSLDKQLFSAFSIKPGGQTGDITARFRWRANSLMMTHLTVNGMQRSGVVILHRGRC